MFWGVWVSCVSRTAHQLALLNAYLCCGDIVACAKSAFQDSVMPFVWQVLVLQQVKQCLGLIARPCYCRCCPFYSPQRFYDLIMRSCLFGFVTAEGCGVVLSKLVELVLNSAMCAYICQKLHKRIACYHPPAAH